jgi:hypothetical protein
MAKFKAYAYRQGVLLPVSLEDKVMPGTPEFAIHTLVKTRPEAVCPYGLHFSMGVSLSSGADLGASRSPTVGQPFTQAQ